MSDIVGELRAGSLKHEHSRYAWGKIVTEEKSTADLLVDRLYWRARPLRGRNEGPVRFNGLVPSVRRLPSLSYLNAVR